MADLNKSEAKKSGSVARANGSFVDSVDGSSKPPNMKNSGGPSSQRPSSIKRMANNMMGIFNTDKGKGIHLADSNMKLAAGGHINDSMSNIPQSDLGHGGIDAAAVGSNNNLPPTKDGARKTSALGSSSTQQQAIRNQIVYQQ